MLDDFHSVFINDCKSEIKTKSVFAVGVFYMVCIVPELVAHLREHIFFDDHLMTVADHIFEHTTVLFKCEGHFFDFRMLTDFLGIVKLVLAQMGTKFPVCPP